MNLPGMTAFDRMASSRSFLLSPRCALPGEAGRAASTLAPIPLPHHLELNVGVWTGVPPVATICVMGFRLQESLRRGLARGRRESGPSRHGDHDRQDIR